jgi:predicted nucleic acid-binding protein
MPIHYLDASAWVKRYVAEEGSQRVNAWINQDPLVASAALGVTEVLSTVVRKSRAGELTEKERDKIADHVWAEFDAFAHVYHTPPVMERTRAVALRFGLRGADTVHLASALWLETHAPSEIKDITMITSDRELAEAAEQAGLAVFDPTREPLPEL